ncbi:hypothetical protein FA95DRAFT_1563030 [Auriscalpium vulgare]|uniref:Uncharacterized protein n=1 Tax=Auriscalpium vulgare TaxID=40419 RepID=A0ACB8RHV8_9AGAM|nr:hypothetical protein FA95DRAFT_1563030 [Auriscalpium vulgare]
MEGDDFPSHLPRKPAHSQRVQLLEEESVHYGLTDPEAANEWQHYLPPGAGTLRYGPHQRAFGIAMYHEIHCLRYMRGEYASPAQPDYKHIQHCLSLLRNAILCEADVTLEPGDFTQRNYTVERVGIAHECGNWEAVYDDATRSWIDWWVYAKANGISCESYLLFFCQETDAVTPDSG